MKKFWWLLLILLALGSYAWIEFRGAQWLDEYNQEMGAQAEEFRQRGAALGATTDQQGCLDQTLEQFNECFGYECTVNHGQYLKACWSKSAPTEGFCDDTPAFRDKPTEDDKSWAKFYCIDRNIRDAGCRLLMRQKQYLCSNP
ncbi:hypothetical protein [Marinobacterium jannaschii]|uniref:hypothetical protein n=1 Tax=Marinobacterium jannaschii TaxID=64970 RepID=UPI000480BCA6|nr:hypothetical protein [Marinobacterium jannaschii]